MQTGHDVDDGADTGTNTNTDEDKAGLRNGESSNVHENDGEGGED